MMTNLGYTEKVLDHFKNPRNPGRIEDADVTAKVGAPPAATWSSFT